MYVPIVEEDVLEWVPIYFFVFREHKSGSSGVGKLDPLTTKWPKRIVNIWCIEWAPTENVKNSKGPFKVSTGKIEKKISE